MALNCGIIGLSSTGKTTIFNCISNTKAEIGFASKSNIGMCEVVDDRLKKIDSISHSKRIVPATVEIVDLPGLSKGGQGVGNKLHAQVQTMDALIHLLRCFDEPNRPHSEGSIDPCATWNSLTLNCKSATWTWSRGSYKGSRNC